MNPKRFFMLLLVVLLLAAFAASPAYAQDGDGIPGLDLTAAQIVIVGLVTSGLTSGIRLLVELAARAKIEWKDEYMQVIVYIAGGVLSYIFFPQVLPAWPDFGPDLGSNISIFVDQWVAPAYVVLTAWFGSATIIYRWLIQRVYRAIGARVAPTIFKKPSPV